MKGRMKFDLEEPERVAQPMPPPGKGIPTVPIPLPVMTHERAALRHMVREAIETKLPPDDLDVICYLIRRAHAMGHTDSLKRS